jgi:hypothetical protein
MAEPAKFEWDKNQDGQVTVCPLENIQTATMSDRHCVVRLEYLVNAGQPNQQEAAVQLSMSRDSAREFAQVLLRLADLPHIPAPATWSQH